MRTLISRLDSRTRLEKLEEVDLSESSMIGIPIWWVMSPEAPGVRQSRSYDLFPIVSASPAVNLQALWSLSGNPGKELVLCSINSNGSLYLLSSSL